MKRRGPRPVNERLRGLLVMLPWLAERGDVSVAEMAERFRVSVDDLVEDLTLASMCGISQDPLHLIDLYIDDDMVHFGIIKYFERPLRLGPHEAASLVVAMKAALAFEEATGHLDPSSPLARAADKMARTLGIDAFAPVDVEIAVPESVPPLRDAVAARSVIELDYWSPDTGQVSSRVVEPLEVFGEGPHWYLRAIDRSDRGERTFRIDRIEEWAITGETHDAAVTPRGEWFSGESDLSVVTIAIEPGWRWVVEPYPVRSAAVQADGSLRVDLVVTSRRWLERLLLRLGSHGRVLGPATEATIGRAAARRVLARYRA